MRDKAILLLEDGSSYEGEALGAPGIARGEVVFSTLMVGYQQLLTTPACHGQILAMTYPLIGNVGTSNRGEESPAVCAAGLIVRECDEHPSNFLSVDTLETYLLQKGIVGLQGIDTRALTRHLRKHGSLRGAIVSGREFDREAELEKLRQYEPPAYAAPERTLYPLATALRTVAVLDYGVTESLLEQLCEAGCSVALLPPAATLEDIRAAGADGVLLSDGPENSAPSQPFAELRRMLEADLPLLGIGLGHQLLAQAAGCVLERLPCGHHGANHPVVFVESGHTVITAQHHGLAVAESSVPPRLAVVSHRNHNDNSVEGLRYNGHPAISVQFLPPATPAPHGGDTVLQQFITLMEGARHA